MTRLDLSPPLTAPATALRVGDIAPRFAWSFLAFLTVLNLPWFLKPVYGIVSDFVPLFGSRRKAYLLLANGLAAAAYFSMAGAASPNMLLVLLLLAVYGMAIASTISGAPF